MTRADREPLHDTMEWLSAKCRDRYCGENLLLEERNVNPSLEVWRCEECQREHDGWGNCMEDYR